LENDLAFGVLTASFSHSKEVIIEELVDRNRRSNNLIFYNLDEVVDGFSSNDIRKVDISLAKNIK